MQGGAVFQIRSRRWLARIRPERSMTATTKLKWREVSTDLIDVPREYVRKQPKEDADKALAASVKLSGIHQPLAVIPGVGGRFTLVKGTRRLAAAEENGLDRVPVVVNFPPT